VQGNVLEPKEFCFKSFNDNNLSNNANEINSLHFLHSSSLFFPQYKFADESFAVLEDFYPVISPRESNDIKIGTVVSWNLYFAPLSSLSFRPNFS